MTGGQGTPQIGTGRPESLKIVVTDPIISRFEDALKADGGAHRWDMAAAWTPERRLDALAGADVVVCSSLGPAEAAAAARARLVHVTGAGYDKISFPHLVPSAIVANTFHHARPIAEHVLMVTLMLSRNVAASDKAVRAGQWRTIATADDVPFHPVLADLTLGLVGLGSIGAEVARVAAALGMKVRAVRRNAAAPLPEGVRLDWVGGNDELNTLLAASDVVVVTVPLDAATEGMIGHAALAAMKPSAFLINVARGPVVDQAALFAALTERRIAGAGLDVWWGSPADGVVPPAELPFASLPNTVLTPHHSGHARVTFERRAADIAANIGLLARGGELRNVVARPAPPTGAAPAANPAK
ncbi:2-hydroxyacid dehydrogenase [Pseudarthrobacter sulfonivorans]|uniref:2-hydroxyacid dehydrogenase n=1 Tax=Pseudarthrobacter sulfonivorans TaxID=121292 RepID=UPI00286041E6|nr:2-hydroxyacid dehydrogenase [Pseudarthrobacter sulfonivorans]MDR6416627.1 phosphoglycerate dehydrogenase-like enzyme [Pseudarthrobacter sulfonivorans]